MDFEDIQKLEKLCKTIESHLGDNEHKIMFNFGIDICANTLISDIVQKKGSTADILRNAQKLFLVKLIQAIIGQLFARSPNGIISDENVKIICSLQELLKEANDRL